MTIARLGVSFSRDLAWMYQPSNTEAIFRLVIDNGMAASYHCPSLGDFIGTALQNGTYDCGRKVFGEARNSQCQDRFATHGINITEGVGSSDLPKGIRVVYNRWEEIDGLHQRQIVGKLVNCRVILHIEAD